MTVERRDFDNPAGSWWAALDDGTVWPVEILRANYFGTTVRVNLAGAPPTVHTLHPSRVYDSDFNRPKWGSATDVAAAEHD